MSISPPARGVSAWSGRAAWFRSALEVSKALPFRYIARFPQFALAQVQLGPLGCGFIAGGVGGRLPSALSRLRLLSTRPAFPLGYAKHSCSRAGGTSSGLSAVSGDRLRSSAKLRGLDPPCRLRGGLVLFDHGKISQGRRPRRAKPEVCATPDQSAAGARAAG